MPNFTKILVFKNEIEAQVLTHLLKENGILHIVKSYHDSAYDGMFQFQKGWGHLEAAEEDREKIESIYHEMTNL